MMIGRFEQVAILIVALAAERAGYICCGYAVVV
jgi:hypothetical protein